MMMLDYLHQQCTEALETLHYRYIVELEPLDDERVAVTVRAEGSEADPCCGQGEVMAAALRVNGVLHRAGWHHVGHGYGHSGGFTSWLVVRADPVSTRNTRRLLSRLQGYAESATDPTDRLAYARLARLLWSGALAPATASGLAAALFAGSRRRLVALRALGLLDG